MKPLLIEIGSEEIPAGYILPALDAFARDIADHLEKSRITFGDIRRFATPRRMALLISGVAEFQTASAAELVGPPASVGFDGSGAPTMAGKKFAEKAGVAVEDLVVRETPRGKYLSAVREDPARPTSEILGEAMPDIIASVPFPKTMRWGNETAAYARPIQWILAVLGETVIPFQYGGVTSGNFTCGHRFMAPDAMIVSNPAQYEEILKSAHVIADFDIRRAIIEEAVARAARDAGGTVRPDPELLDTVANLVEFPAVATGRFDPGFLEVPDEVLITAMREHQKYFSVVDARGRLMPCFVVVNNTPARDMNLVATGHERVLRARLSDARFFFRGDRQADMEAWVEKLKKVLFQARLGSVYDKVVRVEALAGRIADMAGFDAALKADTVRAAHLSKADLVSQVVIEFTRLQGVMGRIYAGLAGEPGNVAAAIEEHYRPAWSGGPLPETGTGAILAIADKMDTLCGCFSLGMIPTGGADPYALRRQGIGILQIMHRHGLTFSLADLITESLSGFRELAEKPLDETADAILEFLKNRVSAILAEEGISRDVIAAVADISIDHVPHLWKRARALESLKSDADFNPLAIAFRRVVNIIRKNEADTAGEVDESRFEDESETVLWNAVKEVSGTVDALLATGEFESALRQIATLRTPVDAFFDGVMVMAEDPVLKSNRLALLGRIAALFDAIADFSRISVSP